MLNISRQTPAVACQPGVIPPQLLSANEPVVLKGVVSHWPLVQQGQDSPALAAAYLQQHYNGKATQVYYGEPGLNGRYFYDASCTRLNYDTRMGRVDEVLQLILAWQDQPQPPSVYIASNLLQTHFPDLRQHNDIALPKPALDYATEPDRVSIWLGNRSLAACHYDASENLACCVLGKRRFSLFPPQQIGNLYPGPLEPTPGGQVISMVDFANPDLQRFPKFPAAIAAGQIAELEPGDALYLPSMWWHQVEALNSFNILINYWWSTAPRYTGSGMNLLYHALLCLRDKPEPERKAWQAVLNYYVFDNPQQAGQHLPAEARGVLGELDEMQARQLRAMLLNRLNR
ncbi:cupin-like domain-containing protein [Rheinheimera sp.]|uniref:cupin-like domain-containing protein n=1 Tax=Rheinheimera sp. TaxID=1869214 RepID=UPI00273266EF|nr:cupin-like domain-containing protein [Rheinheimera sp.]MDP2716880.1 cupin-like domain-containing protein [Rheinheimera sp.]